MGDLIMIGDIDNVGNRLKAVEFRRIQIALDFTNREMSERLELGLRTIVAMRLGDRNVTKKTTLRLWEICKEYGFTFPIHDEYEGGGNEE